jgi:hypothetical protein
LFFPIFSGEREKANPVDATECRDTARFATVDDPSADPEVWMLKVSL